MNNKIYIFNFEAIPTKYDSRLYGAKSTWSIKSNNPEEAIQKAEEHFKKNEQFRFNYSLGHIIDL